MKKLPNNKAFATMDDDYIVTNHWYAEWIRVDAPDSGFKIHVSVSPAFAEITARSVLPKLILVRIRHKVVKSLELYQELNLLPNRGKFITIYTRDLNERTRVIDAIDPELSWMLGPNARGPVPTTRSSKNTEPETAIGTSGLLFCRPFSNRD